MKDASTPEQGSVLPRIWRFLHRPRQEKARSFYARWIRIFPKIPLPVRLPFGGWWLARNDFLGASFFYEGFENPERSFVERFLRPGMVVLDIGAHHGFYTLLASKLVQQTGKVFSFEPSPRERKALLLHKRLNRCGNVSVQALALGEKESTAELHIAEDTLTGLNSLKPPVGTSRTTLVRVQVARLDDWLKSRSVAQVDFIKMDVEGGELAVLQGAPNLLQRQPRPVILAEVQDIRTKPWGYRAKEILEFLSPRGYRWFEITIDGSLADLNLNRDDFDGNFVAVPAEKADGLGSLLVAREKENI
jgi:FkbM family methyltransferase